MAEVFELFEEYGNVIRVSDYYILFQGIRLDYIVNNNGKVEFWAGNLDEDKNAEQLLPSKEDARIMLEEILEYI